MARSWRPRIFSPCLERTSFIAALFFLFFSRLL
jgi:hypothetical protein